MSYTALFASYLEPEFVQKIRDEVPEVEFIYRPDLIGAPKYSAHHTARIERTPEQETEWQALLAHADILFDFDFTHLYDLPDLAPNLKWIQTTSAGIGQAVKRFGYAEKTDWIFTTSSGVHARPLAEFCLMAMLMFAKNYQLMQQAKATHQWERFGNTELVNKTVGIIGLGKIGRDVAKICNFFNMNVIGTRRDISKSVEYVDQVYAPDDLESLLPQVDYLVLATPHTPETEGLMTAERIRLIKKGGIVINIARGAVIDQVALTEALQDGHLGGAALDVAEVEPMPEDDPLWDLPNVIISSHSASTADTENEKIADLFIHNLKCFINGKPMRNVLDTVLMY